MARKEPQKPGVEKAGELAMPIMELKLVAPTAQPVVVKHLDVPPPHVQRRRIHPRRVLPRVKQGRLRQFPSVTHPVSFHLQTADAGLRAATDDLTLVSNVELPQPATQQRASNVDEPSCAAANQGQV